jgi:[protein-PII] uridylyltransferase
VSDAGQAKGLQSRTEILGTLRKSLRQARERNASLWTPRTNPVTAMRRFSRDVDGILRALWNDFAIPQASLIAVGGYGRDALAPFSDVDLLILMPEGYREAAIAPQAEALVSGFWDIGLDAGHSIRSLSECMQQAQDDLTIATALLESRWIAGPKPPVAALKHAWF